MSACSARPLLAAVLIGFAPCIDCALATEHGSEAGRTQQQLLSAVELETQGRYREARTLLRGAAAALAAQTVSQATRTAVAAELGWVEYRLGDFEAAERELAAAAGGGTFASGLERASVLDHLAVVQRERSQYPQAEQTFTRALELAKDAAAPDGARVQAQIYNDRGGLRTYQSDFRSAVQDFELALQLYRTLGMSESVDAAKTLNNLGNAHRELGDMARARTELEQALELKTRLLGPRHPSTASTVNNLGLVAEQTHDYASAAAYYGRAMAIYQRTLGAGHANVASVATQYGRLQSTMGHYRQALHLLERARTIREREFGAYSNWTAETLVDLVTVYTRLGKREEARHGAEQAVATAVSSREEQLLYDCYMSYARALAGQGQLTAAIFFGKRAVSVVQRMRERDVPPSRREQRSFLTQREFVYRDLADWLLTAGRLPEAEQVLDLLKTEELADYAQLRAEPGEPGAARIGMAQREVAAAAALDEAIDQLIRQLALPDAAPQSQMVRVRFIAQLRRMAATLSKHSSERTPPEPGGEGANMSTPGTAVIRYLVLPEQVRILMQTSSRVVIRSVPVQHAELNRAVLDLHHRLQSHLSSESAGRLAYAWLIAPLAAELAAGAVHHLIVVPDDVLRYVPFAALQDGHGYLIESYALSVATPGAARSDATPLARPLRAAAAFGVSRTPDGRILLPNVPIELHRVVRRSPTDHFGALPGIILLDRDFTRDNAARALASSYPVVHIASHFVLRPGSLADSYLLLGDGTHLTLDALKSDALPLRGVEMLTLSACDTAVGELDADGREIESFAALAQRRGARAVLAALWAVPDLSTSVFMARYYASLANGGNSPMARAEALRGAQLLLLRGPGATEARQARTPSPYADPFFWATFELLGSST
jgi:CHAT domain-containing protein/Flp pilus assembly protein TadD